MKKNKIPEGYKKCCRCGEVKLLKKFQKRTKSNDGLAPYCKRCAKKIQNLYKRNALSKPLSVTMYNIMKSQGKDRVELTDDLVFWKFAHETKRPDNNRKVTIQTIMHSTTGFILFEAPPDYDYTYLQIKAPSVRSEEILRRYNRK